MNLISVRTNLLVLSNQSFQIHWILIKQYGEISFKYLIGHAADNIIIPLCVMLPQMRRFKKYFDSSSKNMLFMIKDYRVLIELNEIWGKVKGILGIRLHSEPVYNDEYIKAMVKSINGEIHTNFMGEKIPKEGIHCVCIAIDPIISLDKKSTLKYIQKNANTLQRGKRPASQTQSYSETILIVLILSLSNMLVVFNCLKHNVTPGSNMILGMIMQLCCLFDTVGFSRY